LSERLRIRAIAHFLLQVADLHAQEKIHVRSDAIDKLAETTIASVEGSGVEIREDVFYDSKLCRPTERWREKRPRESAAAYYRRVIAPIPYFQRITTIELSVSDQPLLVALRGQCFYNQRRKWSNGDDELLRARSLSDILPPADFVDKGAQLSSEIADSDPPVTDGNAAEGREAWCRERESAAGYFRRVIAPTPYLERVSSNQLHADDPRLYHALGASISGNNKRKTASHTEDELSRARSIRDVLPARNQKRFDIA
jgi:hypothetical protein